MGGTEQMRALTLDGVTLAPMPLRDAQEIERVIAKLSDAAKAASKRAEEAEEREEGERMEKDAALEAADAAKTEAKAELDKRDAVIATKDTEIADLRQQLKDAEITPDKLDTLVMERGQVIDRARGLLKDEKATFKGKSVPEIRRQVVDARIGKRAEQWSDAQVEASFDSLVEGLGEKKQNGGGNYEDAARVFAGDHQQTSAEVKDAAYTKYDEDLSNAWKGSNA